MPDSFITFIHKISGKDLGFNPKNLYVKYNITLVSLIPFHKKRSSNDFP